MSPSRWVVSALLVCHLAALAIGAIPDPEQVAPVGPARQPTRNWLAATLTPALDSGAALFRRVHVACWHATAPFRALAVWYVGLTGLSQRWRMFMNPPTYDEYLQARYYVGRGSRAEWVAGEIIFPAHREDRVRAFQSFRDSYTDKAIAIALADFLKARDAADRVANGTAASGHDLPRDLGPVVGHFAGRFAARHLLPHEHVLRTEVWRGRVPNPPPGSRTDPAVTDARRAVLRRYYEGPVEERPFLGGYAPIGAAQPEADVVWVLEYAAP